MKAYGNRIYPKGKQIIVTAQNPGKVGETFEVVDTREQVLNIAKVTASDQMPQTHPKGTYQVQAVIIA